MTQASIAIFVLAAILIAAAKLLGKKGTLFEVVYEWEHALFYRNGRFVGERLPGRFWVSTAMGLDIVKLRRTEQRAVTPPQDLASLDGLVFRGSATISYEIVEPRAAYEHDYMAALLLAGAKALIAVMSERRMEEIVRGRRAVDEALATSLGPSICGCRITSIAMTSLVMPPEVRRLFSELERARLEGLAALERARGEHAALRSLANAARMLRGNPELQNLRLMQALALPGRNKTLVLGQGALSPLAGLPETPDPVGTSG